MSCALQRCIKRQCPISLARRSLFSDKVGFAISSALQVSRYYPPAGHKQVLFVYWALGLVIGSGVWVLQAVLTVVFPWMRGNKARLRDPQCKSEISFLVVNPSRDPVSSSPTQRRKDGRWTRPPSDFFCCPFFLLFFPSPLSFFPIPASMP